MSSLEHFCPVVTIFSNYCRSHINRLMRKYGSVFEDLIITKNQKTWVAKIYKVLQLETRRNNYHQKWET